MQNKKNGKIKRSSRKIPRASFNFLYFIKLFYFYGRRKFCRFFIRFREHIYDKSKYGDRENQTDNIYTAREYRTELINHQRHRVGKNTLIADSKPRPFRGVHFSLNSSDSRETGSAKGD